MARLLYGGSPADFTTDGGGRIVPNVALTVWTARTGGTEVTDLLDIDSQAIDELRSGADGSVLFYGPNNVDTTLWLDSGTGPRLLVRTVQITAPADSVTTSAIDDLAVTTAKIDDNAVTSDKLADLTDLTFNSAGGTSGEATLTWNGTDGTLDLGLAGGNVTLQVGQETVVRARSASGTIAEGTVVYVVGSTGNRITVAPARADAAATTKTVLGVATEAIPATGEGGYVTVRGLVRDIDTNALTEGGLAYLSASSAGALTATPPAAPNHRVVVGTVVRKSATVGVLLVNARTGLDLDELCDVTAATPTSGDVLIFDGTVWVNRATKATPTYADLAAGRVITNA